MNVTDRAMRRELDRLSGEIMRRWDEEGDVCVQLNERRERLRLLFCRHLSWWRGSVEFVQWFVS